MKFSGIIPLNILFIEYPNSLLDYKFAQKEYA